MINIKYEDIKYKYLLFHQYLLDFFKDANYFIELKDTYYGYERYNIPANNTFSSVTENIISKLIGKNIQVMDNRGRVYISKIQEVIFDAFEKERISKTNPKEKEIYRSIEKIFLRCNPKSWVNMLTIQVASNSYQILDEVTFRGKIINITIY